MKKISIILSALLALSTLTTKAQNWEEMPVGKKFYIQSAMNYGKNNGGYWDVPGSPETITKGSNIQVWSLDGGHDRQFTLLTTGYNNSSYQIKVGNTSSARIDIQGGKKDNGTSVKVWDKNNQKNQTFQFKHMGEGKFKIYDLNSGKAICLGGRKNANGTNVHIWDDHNGAWMEWYLIDVKTNKAYIPKKISKTPDFFIKNKFLKYSEETMVGKSEGDAHVEKIEGNKIFVKVEGTSYNSDVPPGEPTEKPFSRLLEITYKNGKYIYLPDVYSPGEVSDDGKSISFGGMAYFELTVAPAPKPAKKGAASSIKRNSSSSIKKGVKRESHKR
ncbi:MAG: RICIN domain-containing protein [Bacteroidales bacterium]|nr:RICIN domain-containing protein [Bacteroidales bacterium]MDD4671312.1 RICIN domain-containing protein [Bacteroidales bacterium]MDY0349595.1 RICIN domain-containing protein [Tenuifilaceae bacterium]